MKYNIAVILLFTVHLSVCQTIFSHERKIKNIENYISKEIGFYNSVDDLKISGTLITPKSEYKKIIIIVPGSGKDTRNSHYKLTEEFLKNNIGVYRFDERGVGKSEGKFTKSIDHLSYDLAYAIMHLKSLLKLQEKKIDIQFIDNLRDKYPKLKFQVVSSNFVSAFPILGQKKRIDS